MKRVLSVAADAVILWDYRLEGKDLPASQEE